MNKTTLISLVKKEAAKLRSKATKEERNRLDFDRLRPSNVERCIYGQMTGGCFSPRAHDLIRSCTERTYVGLLSYADGCILGRKLKLDMDGDRRAEQWSPIEIFIYNPENQKNGNNKALVDYIKGKKKILSFKKF